MKAHEDAPVGLLTRVLGFRDCAFLVIGAIIGSGIFLTPSNIARSTQNVEAMFLVWAFGGLLTFCGAISYAELGAAFPEAGGIYVFLSRAYGNLTSFLYGWCVFFVIVPGSIATLAAAFGIYLNYLVPLSAVTVKGLSITLILILTLINCLGIRAGAFVQNLLTVVKIAALVAMMLVLFSCQGDLSAKPDEPEQPSPFPPWNLLGIAMIAVLWSYDGWHLVTFAAGEVKNPQTSLTGGLLVGTLAVVVLYLLVNLAYLQVLPLSSIASSSRVAGDAMEAAVGPIGGTLVAAAILISITGAMNGNVLAGPRVFFAMACEGFFFRQVAYIDPRFQVPTVAIALTGILASFLTLIGTFERLFSYVIFVGWIFYALGAAAVIVLRWRYPTLRRPYKAWGYPWIPLIFATAAAAIVGNTLISDFTNSLWGLTVLAAGMPAYLYWKRKGLRAQGIPESTFRS